MIAKELVRDVELTSKVVTSVTTRVNDVFEPGNIILAVNRNNKDACGLVHYRYEYDKYNEEWENRLTVMSPTFAGSARKLNVFDTVYELQGFYDLVVFDDFTNLEGYMRDNKLEWG